MDAFQIDWNVTRVHYYMLVTILTHSQKFFSFNLLEVNLILNLLFSKLTGIYHSDTLLSADQILTLIFGIFYLQVFSFGKNVLKTDSDFLQGYTVTC